MRGFEYRNVGPRDPNYGNIQYQAMANEPIGGDSYWFGSLEYSLPIIAKEDSINLRFALFYDAGCVGAAPYSFSGNFDDNWGMGIRLDIPKIGPLRLDYGIPIHHDAFNTGGARFQFGVGYTREF